MFVFTGSFEAETAGFYTITVVTTGFYLFFSLIGGFYRALLSKPSGRCGKMAHARISMYMPPDIDPTKAAIAYGCRALPKLNEELQSETLLTRQKALVALCDLMHDPEYVYEAINIGESVIPQPVTTGCLVGLRHRMALVEELLPIKPDFRSAVPLSAMLSARQRESILNLQFEN